MTLTMQYVGVAVGAVIGVVLAELLRVGALPSLMMTAAGGILGARLVLSRQERKERQEQADDARTVRLVDALDAATEADPSVRVDPTDAFGSVVFEGLTCDGCVPVYPPPGHSYPRGDR